MTDQPTPPAVPEPSDMDRAHDAKGDYITANIWAEAPSHARERIALAMLATWIRRSAHAEAALAAERERAEKAEGAQKGLVADFGKALLEHYEETKVRDNEIFDTLEAVEAERAALRAEVEGLRRGLEPFAKLAEQHNESIDGATDDIRLAVDYDCDIHLSQMADATLGDCRHARQLLERPT